MPLLIVKRGAQPVLWPFLYTLKWQTSRLRRREGMKRRRRLEITTHRHEVIAVQVQPLEMALRSRCPVCQCDVNMLPVALVTKTARVSSRTVYRWVEENQLHFVESSDGTVLICENSLRRKEQPA